jgi:head-tail adaptor
MIGPTTSIAERPHRVQFQNPGPLVADGGGGYTQSWIDCAPPAMFVKIENASGLSLERLLAAGVVVASATHIVTAPFHPQVTTKTRLLFNGRVFAVAGVASPEERTVETVMACTEVVQ